MRIILKYMLPFLFIFMPLNASFGEAPDAKTAQTINESDYIKDTAPVGRGELPVLVNKDTKKVEYFRDEDTEEWMAADKSKIDLQKQYDDRNKIRMDRGFKESQEELDRMEEDSFKGWIYDRPK